MPWLKLDDQFADHPKIDNLSHGAFRLHVAGMCYAARYLTDGFIASDRPPRLINGYKTSYLKELLASSESSPLWVPVHEGYMIHDFLVYNKSKEWWEHKREADAKRLQKWRDDHADNARGNTT